MATTETLHEAKLGEPGEPCAECGAPLAADQRYCLNCGQRRGDPRLAYGEYLSNGENGAQQPPTGAHGATAQSPGSGRDWTPFALVGLVAVFGMMLAIGVLIGKGGSGGSQQAAAPVVQVGGGGTTASGGGSNLPTSSGTFKSDWPSGKDGYTVEIGTLPKQGTTPDQVDAAKSKASGQGAPDVGALDSDQYGSLRSGNYVIYSGVYGTKADATKALKPLKSKFSDAKVVQVSAKGASGGGTTVSSAAAGGLTSGKAGNGSTVAASKSDLQALQNASGADYEQQSRRLPDNIKTPGKPPPKDHKPPGGGGPVQTIGP
jgi:hypothetical protein